MPGLGAKVAVVTRTRDRGLLLERAIESVHNQTLRDFIHVIINDGGETKVVDDLVKKYEKLIDGRVHVIHNKKPGGMEAASNKAIKSVDSEFVAIHDDDDTWHKDFLKTTTEYLENSKGMGVVVTTDKIVEKITPENKVITTHQERWLPDVRVINLYQQCLHNFATPITFLYRRTVFKEVGYYDESLPVAGDWDFALRFLLKYDIGFLVSEEALAYYHHRPDGTGIDRNSVFIDKGLLHEQKLNMIANKYLRKEIQEGYLGIGYIMNQLRYSHDAHERSQDSFNELLLETVVRLEGHINLMSQQTAAMTTRTILDKFSAKTLLKNSVRSIRRKKT